MKWRPLLLVPLAALATATFAPARAGGADVLALRGTGIRVGAQMFLLGEQRQPGNGWQKLNEAGVEFKTASEKDGRVVALRCTAPCATESRVHAGEPAASAERAYGQPRKRTTITLSGKEVPFLLYDGVGFELDDRQRIRSIYVLPNA
jgi:hypothetical protein